MQTWNWDLKRNKVAMRSCDVVKLLSMEISAHYTVAFGTIVTIQARGTKVSKKEIILTFCCVLSGGEWKDC